MCMCKIIQTCKVFVVLDVRKSTIVVGFMGNTGYVHKPSPGYAKEPEPQIQQTNLNLSLIQKIRKHAGCVHVQKNSNLQSFHRPWGPRFHSLPLKNFQSWLMARHAAELGQTSKTRQKLDCKICEIDCFQLFFEKLKQLLKVTWPVIIWT